MASSYFTINACNRCRKRKVRCDTEIPACTLCQNSGSVCEYTDPRSKNTYARVSIRELEEDVSRLELEIQQQASKGRRDGGRNSADGGKAYSTADESASSEEHGRPRPDLIRLESGGDAHFLGVSSGMHLARSVLESARQNNAAFDNAESPAKFPWPIESPMPTTATHESTHHVAGAALPSLDTTSHLIDIFFRQYQVQYPILVQRDFMNQVSSFYSCGNASVASGGDPWMRFMLNMVLSISLVHLSRESPESMGLAKGFSSSAMTQLSIIMQSKSHRTLQCLLLLLLSSILNLTSSPIWYISGLCIRMAVDLGFHSERTIRLHGRRLATEDEVDTKRRLFWVAYTFDRTLAIMLGRPFTLEDDNIDVELPNTTLPGQKKPHVLHWLKLQQLQSEIVHRLYTTREACDGTTHNDTSDPSGWVSDMTRKLHAWNEQASILAETDLDWWKYWYHNAMLMLHRPGPMARHSAHRATLTAYESAKYMIHLSFIRVNKGSTDVSWLELHCQLMSGITLLFLVLKSPEARKKAKDEWTPFKSCLVEWQCVLEKLTHRWERMARTRDVLTRLADATIDIVEKEMTKGLAPARSISHRQSTTLDRDQRRSIIQQLGSLSGVQHEYVHQGHHSEHVMHDAPSGIPYDEDDPLRNLANIAEVAGRLPCSSGMDNQPRPSPSQDQVTTPTSYSAQYYRPPQSVQNATFFDHTDLAAILDSEVWSGLQPSDASMQPNFGIFDYLSMPTAGPETVGFPILPLAFGARQDGVFTDSVLNFHSTMDGGQGGGQGEGFRDG